jgi:aspartate/methionine/tyrosine aminotransferase
MAFSHRLLAETGVAVAPGIDFDTEAGGRFIRLSFAGPHDTIRVGLERLGDWLP